MVASGDNPLNMKELLDKISSYNLFNYLFPGILFVALAQKFTTFRFFQENLVIGVFIYYFIGLVISRVGSLVIEPFLKKVGFLKFAEYEDFMSALENDPQIEALSEVNNMYRTLIAVFILLLLLKLYAIIEYQLPILRQWNSYIVIILLSIMFLFAYKKQTNYITKRIRVKK